MSSAPDNEITTDTLISHHPIALVKTLERDDLAFFG